MHGCMLYAHVSGGKYSLVSPLPCQGFLLESDLEDGAWLSLAKQRYPNAGQQAALAPQRQRPPLTGTAMWKMNCARQQQSHFPIN